jgi:hypothetical protein
VCFLITAQPQCASQGGTDLWRWCRGPALFESRHILRRNSGQCRQFAAPQPGEWAREQATATPSPAIDAPGPGKPRVHLELTRPRTVKLYEVDSEIVASGFNSSIHGIQYRSVCSAPCDRVIDGTRGQDFFLATGESAMITASRRFSLDAHTHDVSLRVKPGNAGLRIVGAVLLGIGIGATIGGAVFTAIKSTRTMGYVFLGIGVPSLAAGIPMTIFGRTRYELHDRETREDAPLE